METRPRLIGSAQSLVGAWMILLGLVGAAVLYVFLIPEVAPVAEELAGSGRSVDISGLAGDRNREINKPAAAAELPATHSPGLSDLAASSSALASEPEHDSQEADEESGIDEDARRGSKEAETPTATDAAGIQTARLDPLDRYQADLPDWRRYGTPWAENDPRPRIAVVVFGLGLSRKATEGAIERLPGSVTLSFTPYAKNLDDWIARARGDGHEVMIDLPMEPLSFPRDDPGPHALLTVLDMSENLARLDWVLSRTSEFVGVATTLGSRFTASQHHVQPILQTLKRRGLMFLDNRATDSSMAWRLAEEMDMPWAANDRMLDDDPLSRGAVDARLVQLERISLEQGMAVAMSRPYPIIIDNLAEWARRLPERGYVLAPITALANRQEPR